MLPVTTPLGVVLGFTLPGVFIHLRPFVPWLFAVMTFSGALKLRAREFGETIRSPVPIILFFLTARILMPTIAMFFSSLFFADTDVVAGYVLLLSGPTAVSGFIWVSIYRGDKALCLTLILLDTLLAPLVVPGSVSILMGSKIAMDITGIAISLLLMIVVPTIMGVTVNETSRGKVPSYICPFLDPVSKICLMLVIAANASPIAPRVQFGDPHVWKAAAVCIALTVTSFSLAKLVSVIGKCSTEKSVTLLFSVGLRNFSSVTTIALAFFPEAAVLPALMGIVFQQSVSALMAKVFTKTSRRDAEAQRTRREEER